MLDHPGPTGTIVIAALKQAGIRFVAALPDIVTSDGLLWPISRDPDLRLVRLCKEDGGVAICAGLAATGVRAVLMMQQTGLMDSLNAIRAVAMDYRQPIVMLVGLQGKERDRAASDSASYGVRIVGPVLDAMGLDRIAIEAPGDEALLAPAIERAYSESRPVIALIGRPVA